MDIIQLLPDSVANQIAAGEVIQRPASVIKELVENAIDAGATHVVVNVEDAGKTLIQVIDDGKGMSETDARLAFERHATSKIRCAEDLFALRSMGFRGEALASIAAVAQVELRSRMRDSELGTQINIEGCRVTDQKMVACQAGSTFTVRNLFYNVPARRKFLKSNQTELNNIIQEMERMTLVNNQVAFTLTHNGQALYDLPSGSCLQRIVAVFGRKMHDTLLPIDVDTTMCHITGFVGKPESAKKKGAHQFFFVNKRYMRHPYFHKAIVEAFSHLVPAETQVPYFVYFDVPPADIDVNIHPTKTEIKFENENAIWQILLAAVREALGSFNAIPTIDFDQEDNLSIPAYEQGMTDFSSVRTPDVTFDPTYNPFDTPRRNVRQPQEEKMEDGYMDSRYALAGQPLPEQTSFDLNGGEQSVHTEKSVNHYQFKGQYILTTVKSGLLVVNQHRAHVRILYDYYKGQMEQRKSVTQGLLFPEILSLPAGDALLMEEIQDSLTDVGFEISPLGGGSFSVNGVPSGLEKTDPIGLLNDILVAVRENTGGVEDDVNHRLAFELARRQAIQPGEALGNDEMESIIGRLFACPMPNYTPDGKLVMKVIPQTEFDALFD